MMCNSCSVFGGRHHLVHVLFRIGVLLFVFWAGLMLGQLKGMLYGEYGHGYGMMGPGWGEQGYYTGGVPQMMRGAYYPVAPTTITNVTPTKAAPATTTKQ